MARCRCSSFPSLDTIPADSCPRCCNAYKPRYASFAASSCPKAPNTPHSSWKRSSAKASLFFISLRCTKLTGFYRAFQRIRPSVTQLFDWAVDCRVPLVFDAESVVTGDLADLLRRHIILSRSLENPGNQTRFHRNDRARSAFTKKRKLRRSVASTVVERNFRRQRRQLRPSASRRKARLRDRDCKSAVADIVCRLHAAFSRQRD